MQKLVRMRQGDQLQNANNIPFSLRGIKGNHAQDDRVVHFHQGNKSVHSARYYKSHTLQVGKGWAEKSEEGNH